MSAQYQNTGLVNFLIRGELGQNSLKEWAVWSHSDIAFDALAMNNGNIIAIILNLFSQK